MFLRDTHDILDRIAIADEYDNVLTYKDLENMSKQYLEIIHNRNLIMILCDYYIDTVSLYYCMMNNSVIPILIDPSLDNELLYDLIGKYKPQFIWLLKEKYDLKQMYDIVEETDMHILLKTQYKSCYKYSELALLLSTSGSTGSPKFVRLSYDNLRHNASVCSKLLNLSERDRGITTLPMQFCYGLSLLHMHWIIGATVYITNQNLLSVKFWDYYYKCKITNFHGVPYTYDILKEVGFSNRKHPYLKFVTQGGGKMNEKESNYWLNYFNINNTIFYRLYGLTEGTTVMTGLSLDKDNYRDENIGKTLEGISVRLEKVDNEMYGELVFLGSSISLGYAYSLEDLIKKDENLGELHSGDLAFIDENEYIYIKGRIKRFVKILGKRINLDELEHILSNYYLSSEVACVGEDNKIDIYFAGTNVDEKDVKVYCYKKFKINHRMLNIYNIEKIPRNQAGKILYNNLSKLNVFGV